MRRFILCATLITSSPFAAHAQERVHAVPFGPGERALYDVSLGMMSDVGDASMEIVGVEDVHGHPSYHLRLDLEGRVAFAKVDDRMESWLDVAELFSRRFHQDQDELHHERVRTFEFLPDSMLYRHVQSGETHALAHERPLDDVSFLYFARTLPLEPGKTYTLNRYYKASGNPVTFEVLRREVLEGEGGAEIPVVVVRPRIRTSGLFSGGSAEAYFTDDWRRVLVRLTSRVPVLGRLTLNLKGYTPGTPLTSSGGSGE